MTPLQAYSILIGIYVFVLAEFGFIVWWWRKNNTLLKIDIDNDGALMCKNVRARKVIHKGWLFTNGETRPKKYYIWPWTGLYKRQLNNSALQTEKTRYYWIWDVFNRRPYNVLNPDTNTMVAESMPIIGINKVIKGELQQDGKIHAYSVSHEYPKGARISLNLLSWISESRHELYEETKHIDTKAEMFAKIVVPIGMIVLAVACLVFFPKIYTAIMEQGNSAAASAGEKLANAIKELTPLG